MKAIKYLFVGALMLSFSAPVVAQDNKAAIDEATQLVKSKADAKEVRLSGSQKRTKKSKKRRKI